MAGGKDADESRAVVIKTAMSPEELAEYMGGSIEWADNAATRSHVVFMPRTEFDADYKRRFEDLCERLDELRGYIDSGDISKRAESSVSWCLAWAMDQVEMMQLEQRKLVAWLMEANAEVAALKNADRGAKGGQAAAAVTSRVRKYAIGLAKEREPTGGWKSAPDAADAIMADVDAFARQQAKGRRYARRKVEEWLRSAGIKAGNVPDSK